MSPSQVALHLKMLDFRISLLVFLYKVIMGTESELGALSSR
jgi:hypothetical protein